jgi:hypothetical protein
MSENAEMSTSISNPGSTFLPSLPRRSYATTKRVRNQLPECPSLRSAMVAGGFLLLNLGVYLTAGYLGVVFFKWAWYRFIG